MASNPVLAELVRGNWTENRHRGAFCVVNDRGETVASAGDRGRAIFPRSAIKSMQALALFRSGAVDRFGLQARDIAIACASHHAEEAHLTAVRGLLEKIGCSEEQLECGAHAPSNREARNRLFAAGKKPGAIHNNCSGKHAGMMAVARALGVPVAGYSERAHPVQALVRRLLEEVLGAPLDERMCGTDGCSIPTWAAPMQSFALGFARMATGRDLEEKTARAASLIFGAVQENPFLIAGTGAFDTDAMEAFGSGLICKIGAEGVFCGALTEQGLGFALKCEDGNMRAAEVMVARLLADISFPTPAQREFLEKRQVITLKNWRRIEVAVMRACS